MQSLPEYADRLAGRDDLIWPSPPAPKPVKAKPFSKPIPGIRAVMWDIYGTLLQVVDGCMDFDPKPEIRLEVALEKTIREFNMWNSMTRKPGAPWEYMLSQYRDVLGDERLRGGSGLRRGDVAHVSLGSVWQGLIERLQQKEYEYDVLTFGPLHLFAEKVAYFFHSSLQGTAAYANAVKTIRLLAQGGIAQGFIADAQPFTLLQLARSLSAQGKMPSLNKVFQPELLTFSFAVGARKPSLGLFEAAIERLEEQGIAPDQVLYVCSRIPDDLAVAKKAGFRTALFAGDVASLNAPKELLTDTDTKPDRLVVDLEQIVRVATG